MTRFIAGFAVCLLAAACGDKTADSGPTCLVGDRTPQTDGFCPTGEDVAAFVDPMIGTHGSGNVIPGATLPHGMVKLSPDSVVEGGSVDAYEYESDRIEGFSHTHLQGPGGSSNGYSHILLMPTTGALVVSPDQYPSTFSHDFEEASPGYYAVTLDDYGVRAELTATARVGVHRYTFPAAPDARVLIDVGHSRGESRDGRVTVVDDFTIEGHGVYNVHPLLEFALAEEGSGRTTGMSTVYFVARFSKPFSGHGTWKTVSNRVEPSPGSATESGYNIGAWAEFATAADEVVEVQVGISMVSVETARRNLDLEIADRTFDQVRQAARGAWNCVLGRVAVETVSDDDKTLFYTALYHTLLSPTDYTEADGLFSSGADGIGNVYACGGRRFYSDDWCAWDTFRTSRPLATLVEPETVDDVVASYLHLYLQGGWLPKCTWHATGYSRVMIGNHAVAIIADALTKGFQDYDLELAWEAIEKSATQEDLDNLWPGVCGYLNLGTPPEYLENGYVSHDCDRSQSASMTLEYAYNDWATAQVAEALGKSAEAQHYAQRALNYRNHWDPQTGFMRGRNSDGSWVEPFDPTESVDFCEASSWIYTWFVPHDVPGLIGLVGDEATFVAMLDQFFDEGHFDIGNEPSFHAPYLYNYAGSPHRTQQRVRETIRAGFGTDPRGLPGNDDSGATSAWLALSAMGIYPVAPGGGVYQLTSPLFDRVTIRLHPAFADGDTFVIETVNNDPNNIYIQSATLNGEPLDRTWITHEEITAGGTLTFVLGPDPSSWPSL